jgi:hypothetical protein
MFTLNKQFLFFNAKIAMKGEKKLFQGSPKPAKKESQIKSG